MSLVAHLPEKLLVALLSVAFILLASACSQPQEEIQPSGWVEPGWMATHRMQIEEYTAGMIDCLNERGISGIVAVGGSVLIGGNVGVHDLPGMQEAALAAESECNILVGRPAAWNLERNELLYSQLLDLNACLANQGVEISEPPTFETWRDQGTQWTAWNPYTELIDRIPVAELRVLMAICPQVGATFGIADEQSFLDAGFN